SAQFAHDAPGGLEADRPRRPGGRGQPADRLAAARASFRDVAGLLRRGRARARPPAAGRPRRRCHRRAEGRQRPHHAGRGALAGRPGRRGVLPRAALSHLVSNALEATAAAGSPRPPLVSASIDGDEAQLTVRDWGAGVPTTDPRLLIRLLRSTKPGHAGLGLVTVERVVRLHGGTLRFACPGEGT